MNTIDPKSAPKNTSASVQNSKVLYIASKNRKKLLELKIILQETTWSPLLATDLDPLIEWEENGDSFAANALIKARVVKKLTPHAVLADDSGLCVEALKGAPGIYSARYAGIPSDDDANNTKLLKALSHVPPQKRNAKFVCAIAFIDENGQESVFEASLPGKIVDQAEGVNGFGYDPIFYLPQYRCTLAQLSSVIKNRISHRALALKKWLDQFGHV